MELRVFHNIIHVQLIFTAMLLLTLTVTVISNFSYSVFCDMEKEISYLGFWVQLPRPSGSQSTQDALNSCLGYTLPYFATLTDTFTVTIFTSSHLSDGLGIAKTAIIGDHPNGGGTGGSNFRKVWEWGIGGYWPGLRWRRGYGTICQGCMLVLTVCQNRAGFPGCTRIVPVVVISVGRSLEIFSFVVLLWKPLSSAFDSCLCTASIPSASRIIILFRHHHRILLFLFIQRVFVDGYFRVVFICVRLSYFIHCFVTGAGCSAVSLLPISVVTLVLCVSRWFF